MAGLGGAWAATSSSWSARFIRERIAEIGRPVHAAKFRPDPAAWRDNGITLAWLGHATVLVNFYGVRILTDPAFFSRIGVDLWMGSLGPKRLVSCALAPADLPPIDLVLLTHAHFDHFDTPSLASVPGRPQAVLARDTSDLLPARRFSGVKELRWGERVSIRTPRGDVSVECVEVRHWGARVRSDTHRGYGGYFVEREGRKLLFGGDTADTPLFSGLRAKGPFAAAILPVGAYDPWIRSHCTPEQAVAMADAAGARLFVPIHHRTFKLSNEPELDPIHRTEAALAKEAGRIALKDVGETAVIRS